MSVDIYGDEKGGREKYAAGGGILPAAAYDEKKEVNSGIVRYHMEVLRIGSAGPLVELLQSVLRRLGFYAGRVDGAFGPQTQNAVTAFQRSAGLSGDGVVGASTWNALFPYIRGYDHYAVAAGDTLYNLANRYGTGINRIMAANPGIDAYNLRVGQRLIIPFGPIVPTDVSYGSALLALNLDALGRTYPFLHVETIGYSALCSPLYAVRLGRGETEVFYNGSFHANEWITTPVLMKFIENFCLAYAEGRDIYGHSARALFDSVSIIVAPMVNPDGVDLVTGGIRPGSETYAQARRIAESYPQIPFPDGWKANLEGIDLNLQFPANWEQAREIKFGQGFTSPAPRDYVGPAPLAAAESAAVYRLTRTHDFKLILAYHTQGRVIFWQYLNYEPPGALYIGQRFSLSSGYALAQTPYASSFAGYKDWFIQEYNRPGYTVEAGEGLNPLPIEQFDTIYRENEGIFVLGAALAAELMQG